MKDLEALKIGDVFSLKWGEENVVGIVIKKSQKGIVFDDIWTEEQPQAEGTTVNFTNINVSFKFGKFLFSYNKITPEDTLKIKFPEYYL